MKTGDHIRFKQKLQERLSPHFFFEVTEGTIGLIKNLQPEYMLIHVPEKDATIELQNDEAPYYIEPFDFGSGTLSINNTISATVAPSENDITFAGKDNQEILKLKSNGDIYVKGNLAENDKEIVDGLREFLEHQRGY